ncbi:MAG TPA: PBP1A family penicillin-binding protein [Symbiobacteriaceae bacterium]|nr:PBP1A family penicillin-binding protein [Symbiobacteriaceae bacterium]
MTASRQRKRSGRKIRIWLGGFAIMLAAFITGGVLAGCSAVASAPDVTKLDWDSSTILMDRDGNEIYRLHAGENRTPVKLSQMPESVKQAFIAIEDPTFYDHVGINPRGIARAVWKTSLYKLGLPGGRLEGGSTITQQLARDAWLSQEISMKRKLQEAWVAIQLERTYTKDEILEMYINQIYYGRGAYGIEAAARTFFAKDTGELTVAEAAQLAGMVNGPSYFDPYEYPEDSLQRRNLVLQAMLKEEFITHEQYEQAKAEQPKLGSKESAESGTGNAGHFVDYIINILQQAKPGLAEKFGLKLGEPGSIAKAGLRVTTTLDPELQKLAQKAVTDQMNQADKEYGIGGKPARPEAAMVTMNPKTGEVLAMVGGREHKAMLEFNRATDALRQPGSVIKPFVAYMPALEAGLSPGTILDDAPVMLTQDGKTVWPQNYDFKYLGLRPMRYGVEQSVNPMAVRAMQAAGGPSKAAEAARRFGLSTIGKDDEHLALALGGVSKGTTLLDITGAYSALANMGTKVEPTVITKIVDREGATIYEATPHRKLVVKPSVAYLMIDMMKDVIRKGTAYGFTGGFKGWPAAGKTGTTEYNRDGWFVGFTPELVTAVWNGYDNPDNRLPWTAAFVPVKIWNQFMTQAVTQKPADWVRPEGISTVTICRQTGMLPSDACPKEQVGPELFLSGTEPKTPGDMLVKAKAVQVAVASADKKTVTTEWQLWQAGCAGKPVERTFIKRPQARVLHPTEPFNPKYVPADAKDELPLKVCQPGTWLDRLLPNLPKLPWQDGDQAPVTSPPATGNPATPPTTGNPTTPPAPGAKPAVPAPGGN